MNTKTDLAGRLRAAKAQLDKNGVISSELVGELFREAAEALSTSSDARVGVKARRLLDLLRTDGDPAMLIIPDFKDDEHEQAYIEAYDDLTRALALASPGEREELCEDEGCPHFGTPHVCVSAPASPEKDEPVAWTEPPKLSRYELAAIEKQIEKLGDWIEINYEERMQADAEQDRKSDRALALVGSVFVDAYNRLNTIKWVVEGKKPPSELTAPPSLADAVEDKP